MRYVRITADVAIYSPPTEGSTNKVTQLRNARASLRVVLLSFTTNVDYGYVITNLYLFVFTMFLSL